MPSAREEEAMLETLMGEDVAFDKMCFRQTPPHVCASLVEMTLVPVVVVVSALPVSLSSGATACVRYLLKESHPLEVTSSNLTRLDNNQINKHHYNLFSSLTWRSRTGGGATHLSSSKSSDPADDL